MLFEWDFWVFVMALTVAAFSPGPGLAALVANVMAKGARGTIWFSAGIILGDLVWLGLSLGGLAVIAQTVPTVFQLIKWAGVGYLTFLAYRLWTTKAEGITGEVTRENRNVMGQVLAGFSITMGNPKAMLFYLALLPNLVPPDHVSMELALWLGGAVVVILSSVFAVYILAAAGLRRVLTKATAMQRFNRCTAMALAGAAVWISSK